MGFGDAWLRRIFGWTVVTAPAAMIRPAGRRLHLLLALLSLYTHRCDASILDNGVIGDPKVDCMEDRVKLTFHTERPFTGRIFVKGMIDNEKCVNSYASNSKQTFDYQLINGQCNMRRSRKLGPDQRGVEQSITIVISFHNVFITKVDRAYRCTCFYMEADKVVTNRFDVSVLPTTELIDTARMPLCTYTVRRGSVNGPIVTYATVGEPVYHVWSCDSDMFSMLVHNCFVDDGAGKDRKPLIDEHGCTIDPVIVADLTYNNQANLAYSEVNVFKFADKITTYFQCAVSTCMISEGMCKGKTPPRCGINSRRRRTIYNDGDSMLKNSKADYYDRQPNNNNGSASAEHPLNGGTNRTLTQSNRKKPGEYVMDLAAEKIIVLDMDETMNALESSVPTVGSTRLFDDNTEAEMEDGGIERLTGRRLEDRSADLQRHVQQVCVSYYTILITSAVALLAVLSLSLTAGVFVWRQRYSASTKLCDF